MGKCPSCFQQIPANVYGWVVDGGPQEPDEVASRYAGYDVSNGGYLQVTRPEKAPRNWRADPRMARPNLQGEVSEACPFCHYRLPQGLRGARVSCIAMNGARATGKSFYIAVAVTQLGQALKAAGGAGVAPANAYTRTNFDQEYITPLYEERGLIQASATAATARRDPLVFSLGVIRGQRHFLAIRDVAGEEMENPSENPIHLMFFRNADAILFMFDPLAVPLVSQRLEGVVPRQNRRGGDPQQVLANLYHILHESTPRLGVILSKFDALQELRNVEDERFRSIMANPGARFSRDPSLTGHVPPYDRELLHEEVRSLLFVLGGDGIVTSLDTPHSGKRQDYQFFAVSVLGDSPEGASLSKRGIAPFRCLDPIRWALSSTGLPL